MRTQPPAIRFAGASGVVKTRRPTALEALIAERYDVDPVTCPALTVEWAAEILADSIGELSAVLQWRRLNACREKAGRYSAGPAYGGKLWSVYYATSSSTAAERLAQAREIPGAM